MLNRHSSDVLVIRTNYDSVPSRIDELKRVLPIDQLRQAESIAIKINFCDARTPETGAVTDIRVLDAVLAWIRSANTECRICVVESDGIAVLANDYRRWFGVDAVLARWNAEWVNLTEEPQITRHIKGRHLSEVPVPKVLNDSYVISLSKLKTNLLSTITCALKNQYGCLPMVDKFKYHPYLADVITDINLAMRPDAFIVDGIIGLGGIQGPTFGTPIQAGVILAGIDPVAVDAACCKIMGYQPLLVSHVRKCLAGRSWQPALQPSRGSPTRGRF